MDLQDPVREGWGDGPELEVDEYGYPVRLPEGVWAETPMNVDGSPHPGGTYTITYSGSGTLTFWDLGGAVKETMREPGRFVLDVAAGSALWLRLQETDPEDPVRDIRVTMPGFEPESAPIFHPEYIESLSPYSSLRFMDWGSTNNNPLVSWEDRPQLQDRTYTTNRGAPLELMVALANQTGKTPWFCVPHQADDDYVRNMAILIRDNLDPELDFYLEYSNEVWNGIFEQHGYARERGKAEGLGDGNDFLATLQYQSRRSVEIFTVFEEVFGGTERMVRVLAGQSANPWVAEQVLTFEDAHEHADAVAIAPYFGGGLHTMEDMPNWTVEDVLDHCEGEIETKVVEMVNAHAELANRFGLELVAYEGGQHLVGDWTGKEQAELNELFDEANRHPRMEALYRMYLDAWFENGGGLFMNFSHIGAMSKHGRWGVLEYQGQPVTEAPKYRAIVGYGD